MVESSWTKEDLNRDDALFYMASLNRFIDGQWYIVHDLNKLFDNWQLDKWKKNGNNDILKDKDGKDWMLYFLNDDQQEEVLDFIAWNESYNIKMDRRRF